MRLFETVCAAICLSSMHNVPAADAPAPQRLFVSGHSLTAPPLPAHLAAIAASQGTAMQWQSQGLGGSQVRGRTRGRLDGPPWEGYRTGDDRDGKRIDVLSELRSPKTVTGGRYDALLITEQHWVLHALTEGDMMRHLRHFHDRFIEANPQGRTWFFEPWISLDNLEHPQRWIALERQASRVWRCAVTRVNASLAAAGRSDRLVSLPMGAALADLIDAAISPSGVRGLTVPGDPRATLARLLSDEVHYTPLGSYYLALVAYAAMTEREPRDAWIPADIDPSLGRWMQAAAWRFTSTRMRESSAFDLPACRQYLSSSFIAAYSAYFRDFYWKRELGTPRAWLRWARHRVDWAWRFRHESDKNPFYSDARIEKTYWLAAP
jgi:hypothetical protein